MNEQHKSDSLTTSFLDDLNTSAQAQSPKIIAQSFFKIRHVDALPPFFISIVSSSNHWLFISSNGGLSAGRKNSDQALFPYYTEDKITDNAENTGSKTLIRLTRQNQAFLWEPFSIRQSGQYELERSLYKNSLGTSLIFEEINRSLNLRFRYA